MMSNTNSIGERSRDLSGQDNMSTQRRVCRGATGTTEVCRGTTEAQ